MEPSTWFQRLALDVRIAVEVAGRPPTQYVVRLEVRTSDGWRAVHVLDNAHGAHDEHDFRGTEKQPARSFFVGSVREAIPRAIELLNDNWQVIIERWRKTT